MPAGFGSGALELAAQLRLGYGDTFLFEVGPHLVDDIVISRRFEVCRYNRLGISLRLLAGRQTQPRGRPQPEPPVASRRDPEPQFLVVLELGSKPFSRSVKLFIPPPCF